MNRSPRRTAPGWLPAPTVRRARAGAQATHPVRATPQAGLRAARFQPAVFLGLSATQTRPPRAKEVPHMNAVTLTGRLTRDPELRELPSGGSVCNLRLAVDRMGRGEEPGYIAVDAYGAQGEACAQVLTKGWLVAVHGRLEYREWTTQNDTKRSTVSVAGHVEFLAAPRTNQPAAAEAAA